MMTMKTILFTCIALCATALVPLRAAGEAVVGGPKGGRLLETEPLKAEFFVTPERKVEVIFYDAAMKPTAPTTQTVAVTAEAPSGRTKLDFEKTPTGFLSTTPLPDGDGYRVVAQVRPAADAKPQNFRITLAMHTCAECDRTEYACTCGH